MRYIQNRYGRPPFPGRHDRPGWYERGADLERQRLIADAIVLERAARVLGRRCRATFAIQIIIRTLTLVAARLRRRAGHTP
jgi:hypothetical protein